MTRTKCNIAGINTNLSCTIVHQRGLIRKWVTFLMYELIFSIFQAAPLRHFYLSVLHRKEISQPTTIHCCDALSPCIIAFLMHGGATPSSTYRDKMCLASCMYAYTCMTRAMVSLRYCHAKAITPQHCILCQQFVLTDWWHGVCNCRHSSMLERRNQLPPVWISLPLV